MFSVVIPVYNHAQYIRGAVASAMQSQLVTEVLLVDDGSRDASADIIAGLARQHPRLIRDLTTASRENWGAHARLNQLCELASNDWIAILNSDDEFVPSRFEVAQTLARTSDADLIGGALLIIDGQNKILGEKRGLLDPEYAFPSEIDVSGLENREQMLAALCSQNFFATTTNMVFRKSFFRMVGGFSDLRYSHDWDFALKAAIRGKVRLSRSYFARYRIHESNTIKEVSGHVDGEILRFFMRILSEYPEIEKDPLCRAALKSNRHLSRYVPGEVVAVQAPAVDGVATFDWPRRQEYYAIKARPAAGRTSPSASRAQYTLQSTDILPFRALENSAVALQWGHYDFTIISQSLAESPSVSVEADGRMNGVFNARAAALFTGQGSAEWPLRGRIIRCAPREESDGTLKPLTSVPGFEAASVSGSDIVLGAAEEPASPGAVAFPPARNASGPLILVLPMFLAVGGVERNTIEVIRMLRDRYRFVVVTTEWQAKHQGSLHYQLDAIDVPVLDLAEICDRSQHVALLAAVQAWYKPDAVWICNGSPWLADNAEEIRRIFSRTPIVDQQVYDTEHGWINRYSDPGIQSFDHFISINTRIKAKFVSGIRIPPHRISLIYSVIDTTKLSHPLANADQVRMLKAEVGATPDQRCFAFIGRLTGQKQPLHFLALARRSLEAKHNDHFLLVGDGELGGDCDHYIAEHNLTNVTRIRYYDDSWAMMSKIDGLVVTSAFEGLPIVLLEAMAFGRPAFATDVGDIKLVLDDYGSGSVVDPDASEGEMWQAFRDWHDNLAIATANALRHRSDVLERFSSRTISRQYAEIWDRLIAENALADRRVQR
ncbi:MAG: glycosyltransferase [Methylobacterium sp.]|jgi:glycosyltransferase involved in cell wall biosynthesis|uniref:glycosyltransferase n=1 Tax=Methylobacterium sp. TaxID=409 RepID=UPI0025F9AE30|nr:glycosyltransferase [Methylobacterium sp.]MBX9934868.1 glycosyltransferase [Methylobacterium sp.]